ncbi:hypothetical protein PGTUg99_025413 [Puccinia graminis f. sp. tritici]|uniref:Uncharacterized protein n=1 Tax=Puccinia graminis f. sp. tritici TaxID=56615 RepID=A0A5B0RSP2_PUCGR|nr:hypothetical protein PGTUg99_025413 [Puccinia graminis f. sp. tritici]
MIAQKRGWAYVGLAHQQCVLALPGPVTKAIGGLERLEQMPKSGCNSYTRCQVGKSNRHLRLQKSKHDGKNSFESPKALARLVSVQGFRNRVISIESSSKLLGMACQTM